MTARELLPNRRRNSTLEFSHAGMHFTLCAGMWPDGRIAEVFISSNKPGSPIEAVARDGAILASLCLQHGCDIGTIHRALTKDHDGAAATAIGAGLAALLAMEASQ
jgi:ribonucleoside-diphosphate reductase alpha chain